MHRRAAVSILIGGIASVAFRSPQKWVTVADSLTNSNGRTYTPKVLAQLADIVNKGTVHLFDGFSDDYEEHGDLSRLAGLVTHAQVRRGTLQIKAKPFGGRDLRGKYIVTACMGTVDNSGRVVLAEDPKLYFALDKASSFTLAEAL